MAKPVILAVDGELPVSRAIGACTFDGGVAMRSRSFFLVGYWVS